MSEESDNDLYYNSDDYSENESEYSNSDGELVGGSYQLASDYSQYYDDDDDEYEDAFGDGIGYGIGYGMGGVLMGGKRELTEFNKFFAMGRKKGLSAGEVAACWRKFKKTGKKSWTSCGKSISRKKPMKSKRKVVKRSTRAMSKTAKKPTRSMKKTKRFSKVSFAPYDKFMECKEKGMKYCPLTGRCRGTAASIQKCYDESGIPYKINESGMPVTFIRKYPKEKKLKYFPLKEIQEMDGVYYYRGKLLPMKKKK